MMVLTTVEPTQYTLGNTREYIPYSNNSMQSFVRNPHSVIGNEEAYSTNSEAFASISLKKIVFPRYNMGNGIFIMLKSSTTLCYAL